jgi:hypothetical protein
MFCEAGFRPGRRGPFVSAKGPKTSEAPSGLIRWGERGLRKDGPTRFAQTRPTNLFERSPRGPDGRPRTLGGEHFRAPHERDRKGYVFRLARLYG